MKKTININLFGTLYTIDEDACKLLEEYLDSIKLYFSRQDGGEEIADDIEHRVAELLWEKKEQGVESIDLMTVKTILKQIGNPEEMGDSTANEDATSTDGTAKNNVAADDEASQEAKKAQTKPTTRKFFRDPKDKVLGGVISGITQYFGGSDPLPWRIIFIFVSIFLHIAPFFIIYIVLWVLIPEAKTAEDRLRMKGKTVNPDTIQEQVLADQEKSASTETSNSSNGCAKGCFIVTALIAAIIICGMFFVTSIWTSLFDMIQNQGFGNRSITMHDVPIFGAFTGIIHNLRIFVAIVAAAILVALYFILFHTSKKSVKIMLLIAVCFLALLAIGSIKHNFPKFPWINYTYTHTSNITRPDGSICEVRYKEIVNGNDTIIQADTIMISEPLQTDDFAE
ncbi:MAG: PspC domain-containing protein [Bacteroidales bacterium]|nr:PspC domain-containing protein [Bacteroidales bacterium]